MLDDVRMVDDNATDDDGADGETIDEIVDTVRENGNFSNAFEMRNAISTGHSTTNPL